MKITFACKFIGIALLAFLLCARSSAQPLPMEESVVNYRIIGFSAPSPANPANLTLEIAIGKFNNEDSFKRHIMITRKCNAGGVVAEVPYFGRDYTWRVSGAGTGKLPATLHHFSTSSAIFVDTANYRLRIIMPAKKFDDYYIFSDASHALYDMKGNPVWFLRGSKEAQVVRDLKLTPQGTISFLLNQSGYDISYSGDTLWQTPSKTVVSGDTSEHFHHDFTRLANGHYMVLGSEYVKWEHKPAVFLDSTLVKDPARIARLDSTLAKQKTEFGTIIEYDQAGNVVWSWKSSSYFMESDLRYYPLPAYRPVMDVHENAFWFDEDKKVIYVSFKNIGRIVKISYPGGEVLSAYGEIYGAGHTTIGDKLFCDQHSCKISKKGYLYLFNNNSCNEDTQLPQVQMFREPASSKGSLEKVWEYECSLDGVDTSLQSYMARMRQKRQQLENKDGKNKLAMQRARAEVHNTSGGNVVELPDQSMFVCMNSQFGKMFIVSPDKKILWSAVAEKIRQPAMRWALLPQQYRASIISRHDLEQLIWNTQKTR